MNIEVKPHNPVVAGNQNKRVLPGNRFSFQYFAFETASAERHIGPILRLIRSGPAPNGQQSLGQSPARKVVECGET